jgi:hypothetical protein
MLPLMLVVGLLLALLTHSWTPLLGAGAVVALILMGERGVCGVLIAVFGSALYIADWWVSLRRNLAHHRAVGAARRARTGGA